jgi:methylated-DNA-[protein]-cysteine S-methyltransferase
MEFWMFDTLLGTMAVGEEDGHITRVYLPNSPMPRLMPHKTPLLERAEGQIREYFDGRRQEFDLPLTFVGTDFQKKVWQALTEIPYGKTVTYGALAERIGCPGGARAVGAANHCNPLPILVPCHRVVGAGGNLTGYAGGMEMKKFLLELEQGKNHL